jgi:predicted MPP superfamily phosphohydrolase
MPSGAGTWGPTMRTGNRPEIAVIQVKQAYLLPWE